MILILQIDVVVQKWRVLDFIFQLVAQQPKQF